MQSQSRFTGLFETAILPLLMAHGWDRERGGVIEKLTPALKPADVPYRRSMLHARQLFLFSIWADKLASPSLWAQADRVHAYLSRHFHRPHDGCWIDRVDLDGKALDTGRSLYSHAFLLLGVGTYGYLRGNDDALAQLAPALRYLDEKFARPDLDALYRSHLDEGRRGPHEELEQNPHMHLFEALLQLHALSGDAAYLGRAGRLLDAVRAVFFDGSFIVEHARRSESGGFGRGTLAEPGHQTEWAWLLAWYARLSDDKRVAGFGRTLYARGLRHGWDPEHGGLFDELDARSGQATGRKRMWPLLETIKAAGVYGNLPGCPGMDEMLSVLLESYLLPDGRWVEWQSRDLSEPVGEMPLSSGYHLGWAAIHLR